MKISTMRHIIIAAAIAIALSVNAMPQELPVTKGPFKPDYDSFKQYRYPDWFRDAKLGIWAVWGVCSVPMQGDWYSQGLYNEDATVWPSFYKYHVEHYGHPSVFGYKDLIPLWKAANWNPDRLMDLYKRAGARYFCALAVFCDNTDYWNSKYHRWNSVQMGPCRDIVGDWSRAARKRGLRFGVSEHLGDWWNWLTRSKGADKSGPLAGVPYDGNDSACADLYSVTPQPNDWFRRMADLIDSYRPDLFYTDGGLPYPDQVGKQFLAYYYNRGRQRHGGKDEVVYTCKQDSQGMWVQDLERGVMDGIRTKPWQTDTCVGDWHYKESLFQNHAYRTPAMILQMLADIVSKNGNLLLNFPPRPDGTLDADELAILKEMAAWMPINGEAIFGTRPWKVYGEGPSKLRRGSNFNEGALRYTERDIRFTTKGNTLYALLLGWPEDGKVVVRSLAKPAGTISSVALLGHSGSVNWSQTDEGLVVTLPQHKPCNHVFSLKIAGKNLQPAVLPSDEIAVATPDAKGRITLAASTAEIEGDSPQYVPEKEQIGYWADPSDYVWWNFTVTKPGKYTVELTYSCADPGSEFTVEVGNSKLTCQSHATGSWDIYTTEVLGEATLDAGRHTLAVKPKKDPKWKVIGIRSLVIRPIEK